MNEFCSQRYSRSRKNCSWNDYYAILDDIREPFEGYFDPGAKDMIPVNEVYNEELPRKLSKNENNDRCDTIVNPSARDFYQLVKASHPTIIKGGALNWPALSKWSLDALKKQWRDKAVVASISPTGDFDGPEEGHLWGLAANESVIIARPAHAQMKFQDFVEEAQRTQGDDVTHYLEYFPLKTLESTGSKDVPSIKWANFLSSRFTLVWFGMSGVRNPVGRLHYDRHENLMAMVAGSKQFVLYGPDQGEALYAATPLRSGSLVYQPAGNVSRHVEVDGTTQQRRGRFIRDKTTIDDTYNEYHTYSPVDITRPDYAKYPKFRNAKKKVCDVAKGDILFVPSDWWHQVTSKMDDEGKSIGVNIFFEPFYKKPGYMTLLNSFVRNRYYSHISDIKSVRPCRKRSVCFVESSEEKTSTTTSSIKRRKKKRRKLTDYY